MTSSLRGSLRRRNRLVRNRRVDLRADLCRALARSRPAPASRRATASTTSKRIGRVRENSLKFAAYAGCTTSSNADTAAKISPGALTTPSYRASSRWALSWSRPGCRRRQGAWKSGDRPAARARRRTRGDWPRLCRAARSARWRRAPNGRAAARRAADPSRAQRRRARSCRPAPTVPYRCRRRGGGSGLPSLSAVSAELFSTATLTREFLGERIEAGQRPYCPARRASSRRGPARSRTLCGASRRRPAGCRHDTR